MGEVLAAGVIALAITALAVAVVCFGAWVVLRIYDKAENER